MVLHLLNHKREQLSRLETLHKCKIILNKENTVYYDGFGIEKTAKNEKTNSKREAPKFNDNEHIDAYGLDVIEDDVITQEAQLGLGADLAPYNVNENIVITESIDTYTRNNRGGKYRNNKGFNNNNNNNNNSRRKISNAVDSDSPKQPPLPAQQPALIYQPEAGNVRKRPNNRRKPGKFHDRRDKNIDGNKPEKKSALKSWWDKLIE